MRVQASDPTGSGPGEKQPPERTAGDMGRTPVTSGGDGPILFFDGECGLCDGFAAFLLRADRKRIFRLAPLAGKTARALLPDGGENWETLVLLEGERLSIRSEAVIRTLARLGGLWKAIALVRVVPRPLRDTGYDFIARHRRKWFPAPAVCIADRAGMDPRWLP